MERKGARDEGGEQGGCDAEAAVGGEDGEGLDVEGWSGVGGGGGGGGGRRGRFDAALDAGDHDRRRCGGVVPESEECERGLERGDGG